MLRSLLLALLLIAPAWAEPLPADSGALDVRAFGAKGDGKTDDTAALLAAIAASGADTGRAFWQDRTVYLPDGVYLVSATLEKRYAGGGYGSGLLLMGQSQSGTVIRLMDGAPGFADPGRPRAVVYTASKHLDGTPTGGGKDYPGLGEGNDAYLNSIEDLTIDVGAMNPGAVGIDYLANNIGAIRDVTLRAPAGSGVTGLSMLRKWPGPALIQRLSIDGFAVGIDVAHTQYGLTFEHIRLSGQGVAGLRNTRNALAVRGLHVTGGAPPVVNRAPGGLVAIDGGTLGGAVDNAGTLVLRGVAVGGEERYGVLTGADGWQDQARPDWAMTPQDTPVHRSRPDRWANAAKFGAVGDGATDATAGLRRAFASGAATIYLPTGTYLISDAVEVPASVRRIVGMNSTIRPMTPRARSFARTSGMLRVLTGGRPLEIGRLAFDNTNGGLQVAIEAAGPRDVVVRDVVSAGVTLLDRKAAGGAVFIEDVCCGRIALAGPAPVFARQLDTEGAGVRILNDGAPLWILGLKTEGAGVVVDNRGGARTEVFGGLMYVVRETDGTVPAFRNEASWLSATFVEEVLRAGRLYRTYVRQVGETERELPAAMFQERGMGRMVGSLRASPVDAVNALSR